MLYRFLADSVVVLHLGFILFVVLGGLLVLRWRRLIWIHLPAAAWGAVVELSGWICPLTPLERRLRELAGQSAYEGGFIERYLIPIIYPDGLTREMQYFLGGAVVLFNVLVYAAVWRRHARSGRGEQGSGAETR